MNKYYLTLPIRVYDVNVDASFHTHGLPSLSGVDGFCHALMRNINKHCDESYQHAGFSYVLNSIEYKLSKKRHVACEFSDRGKTIASMTDDKLATIDQTLIVMFYSDKDKTHFYSEDRLNRSLAPLSFLGGHFTANTPNSNEGSEPVRLFDGTNEGFIQALRTCRRNSFIVEDVEHLLECESVSGNDRWEKFTTLMTRDKTPHEPTRNKPQGHYVAAHAGYALLESPKIRKNTRDPDTFHSYAETVISPVRCRTVSSALIDIKGGKYLWSNSALNANDYKDNLYIVYGVYI